MEPLAELFVKLVADGIENTSAQVLAITKRMNDAHKAASNLEKAIKSGAYGKMATEMERLRKRLEEVRRAAQWQDMIAQHGKFGAAIRRLQDDTRSFTNAASVGFAIATASTLSWVRAGLQGTVEGNRISMGFQLLSREIAGVFKPAIDSVTKSLFGIVGWFRSLSKEQQANIRIAALWVVGILGAAVAFKILIGVILATQTAMMALGTAITTVTAGYVSAAAAAKAFGVAAVAAAAISRSTDDPKKSDGWLGRNLQRAGGGASMFLNYIDPFSSSEARKKEKRRLANMKEDSERIWASRHEPNSGGGGEDFGRGQVTQAGGQFESVSSSWDRMASEFMKLDSADPAKQSVIKLEEIKGRLEGIAAEVSRFGKVVSQGFNQPSVK